MSFSKPDPSRISFGNEPYSYANPENQPLEALPAAKTPDPLSGNWSYDNAIDLFSINTMLPDTFPMDLPDPPSLEPNYFSDPFAPPPEISGFAISNNAAEDAASHQSPSDIDSDDPLWSPPCATTSPVQHPAPGINTREQTPETQTSYNPGHLQSKRESVSTESTSSEEHSIERTEHPEPRNQRTSRRSKGSSTSSQAPTSRKAAKRAAHNVIEKRYRTNMNAKFVALEKATCGAVHQPTKGESGSLKKSEILANAISYVQKLQEDNKSLQKELVFYKQSYGPRGEWRPKRTK